MSNNSHKNFDIFKTKENPSNQISKVLSVIEDLVREFIVAVKYQGNSTTITIQDNNSFTQGIFSRIIFLKIFSEPKSYTMNLYHQLEGSKNQKHVYEIKVKGNYEIITLKNNLEKLLLGKNLIHRPRFYPF